MLECDVHVHVHVQGYLILVSMWAWPFMCSVCLSVQSSMGGGVEKMGVSGSYLVKTGRRGAGSMWPHAAEAYAISDRFFMCILWLWDRSLNWNKMFPSIESGIGTPLTGSVMSEKILRSRPRKSQILTEYAPTCKRGASSGASVHTQGTPCQFLRGTHAVMSSLPSGSLVYDEIWNFS